MRIATIPVVGFDVHIINKEIYLLLALFACPCQATSDVGKNIIKTLKSPIVLLIAFFAT